MQCSFSFLSNFLRLQNDDKKEDDEDKGKE
jgi:hypothetical protein